MDETTGGGIESGWAATIDGIIGQIEIVSEHFHYTEEYVLDHTLAWLSRKYKQAMKSQFNAHNRRVIEGYKALTLLIDSAFNKGKGWDTILPQDYEKAIEREREGTKDQGEFITEKWWG